MTLQDRIKKNSKIADTSFLNDSKFFTERDMIPTRIPVLNVALSGQLTGGLTPGLTMFAGPSKHFKTLFALVLAKAYMDKYDDAVLLFYDSEFGTPISYFDSMGIDKTRVVHSPITDVEQLKFDIMSQLTELGRDDHVIVVIDSIGNLASKKEVEDALDEKSVSDMTRAKQIKSLFRMVTPYLAIKDIPMIVVNHTYKTMEMFSKDVVGGGTGSYYSADNIFIVGRQQEKSKDKKSVTGYNFILNVEKSRYVREKSKIPVFVSFTEGLSTWTGLLDLALEAGAVVKPKKGWYSKADMTTGEIDTTEYKAQDTNSMTFWLPILQDPIFQSWIKSKYALQTNDLLSSQDVDDIINSFTEPLS